MKHVLGLLALSAGILVMTTERAEAQTYYYVTEADLESPWDKVFAFEGHLGVGTPVGMLGLTVELSPTRWLTVAGGGGIGISGFQWAAMPRLRLIAHTRGSVQLGAGVSGGGYTYHMPFADDWENQHALWVNAEVSYQFRAYNGFQVRPYLGASVMSNPGEIRGAQRPVETGDMGTWLLYTGVAIGAAF
jgi:hypothetical protein